MSPRRKPVGAFSPGPEESAAHDRSRRARRLPALAFHATRFSSAFMPLAFHKEPPCRDRAQPESSRMRTTGVTTANQIDVVASEQARANHFDVGNGELARDFFRMFATAAGNRDDFSAPWQF